MHLNIYRGNYTEFGLKARAVKKIQCLTFKPADKTRYASENREKKNANNTSDTCRFSYFIGQSKSHGQAW